MNIVKETEIKSKANKFLTSACCGEFGYLNNGKSFTQVDDQKIYDLFINLEKSKLKYEQELKLQLKHANKEYEETKDENIKCHINSLLYLIQRFNEIY